MSDIPAAVERLIEKLITDDHIDCAGWGCWRGSCSDCKREHLCDMYRKALEDREAELVAAGYLRQDATGTD